MAEKPGKNIERSKDMNMTQKHDSIQILSEGWRGKYDMILAVRAGGVVENVTVSATPPIEDAVVHFDHSSAFSRDVQDEVAGISLWRYWGLEGSEQ